MEHSGKSSSNNSDNNIQVKTELVFCLNVKREKGQERTNHTTGETTIVYTRMARRL